MKFLIEIGLKKLYLLLWLFLHFVYCWQNEIRESLIGNWKHVVQRLSSCFPSRTYCGELVSLTKSVDKFNKIPRHLAISVIIEGDSELDLQTLAKIVSWAWVARIPVVTLYDYHGKIKSSYRELGCYVREELIQNFWALKKFSRGENPPAVKFHNIPKLNGYANGIHSNGYKLNNDTIHIVLTSYQDGKPEIVRIAKEIRSRSESEDNFIQDDQDDDKDSGKYSGDGDEDMKPLDEKTVDELLSSRYEWAKYVKSPTDPEVLMIVGDIQSTLGFLPWQMRLTEIHWLPKLHMVEIQDFYHALARYSKCQQRFGT